MFQVGDLIEHFSSYLRLLHFFQRLNKWMSRKLTFKKKVVHHFGSWLVIMTTARWRLLKQEVLILFCFLSLLWCCW